MPADLILRNGRLFTADPARPHASSLAVSGDRIVAVGADGDVEGLEGPRSEIVDLGGRLVAPGFIDAHVHPASSGHDKLRLHFDEAFDQTTALEVITSYAAEHPELDWIVGAGWSQGWFDRGCPSRALLDRLIPDRPALIWNTDGHGAWANTVALAIAGIDHDTTDPVDGRIEREPDGSPQGTLHEGAIKLVERFAPPETADDLERGLIRGQEELLSLGVTGWQVAIVTPEIQAAYVRVAGDGRLKGRVVGALWWDRARGLKQVDELVERREMSAPGFRPTSVKLMLDGVAENFTASMIDPWLGPDGLPTDNRGVDFIDLGALREIVIRLDALGFQCHFHAIGDRAVRNALDGIEAARDANGPSDNRHHIAHIQVIHPDDIPRFARLGAVANAQALWACHDTYQDELTIPFLGPERSAWQYPFGSLLRSGARMGMGSDWGVSSANPLAQMAVAVNRTDGSAPPFYPSEALTVTQALSAFTVGSAHINHLDGDTGSLAVGKLADLVVLDHDPIDAGSLREARVELTMIGGRVVYEET